MVTLCSLFEEHLVLLELCFIRERDTVHALKRVVRSIAQEIRCRVLNEEHVKLPTKPYSPSERTLVTMNALILPVWGIWGPTQRSTIGPQRYTVVDVPSGILVSMMYFLYLLYYTTHSMIKLSR